MPRSGQLSPENVESKTVHSSGRLRAHRRQLKVHPSSIMQRKISSGAGGCCWLGKRNPIEFWQRQERNAIDLPRTAVVSAPWLARQIQHNPENARAMRCSAPSLMTVQKMSLLRSHSLYALRNQPESDHIPISFQAARAATYGAFNCLLIDIDDVTPATSTTNGAVDFCRWPQCNELRTCR